MAPKGHFLAKFQKSAQYIFFAFLWPTFMPIFKKIEESGNEFYYFEGFFKNDIL